jgi:hypothetical protein
LRLDKSLEVGKSEHATNVTSAMADRDITQQARRDMPVERLVRDPQLGGGLLAGEQLFHWY